MKAFRQAAAKGDLTTLKALWNNRQAVPLNINEAGPDSGNTALHVAAAAGHKDCVQWLAEQGADLNILNNKELSALQLAVAEWNKDVVVYLIEKGAQFFRELAPMKYITPMQSLNNDNKEIRCLEDQILYNDIRKILTDELGKQAHRFAQNMPGIKGLNVRNDAVYFIHADKVHQVATESHKAHVVATGDGEKYITKAIPSMALKDKEAIDAVMRGQSLRLPPLFFFMEHEDPAVVKTITALMPLFKELGYSKFCFEFDDNMSLCELQEDFQLNINLEKRMGGSEESKITLTLLNNLELLKVVEKNKRWLTYQGVDVPMGALRSEKLSRFMTSEPITEVRDQYLADKTLTSCVDAEGGVIGVFGAAHSLGIMKVMEKCFPYLPQAQFLGLFEDDSLVKTYYNNLKLKRQFNGLALKVSTKEELDSAVCKIRQRILDSISEYAEVAPFSKIISSDSKDLPRLIVGLNERLPMRFDGVCDFNHHVDAVAPVASAEDYLNKKAALDAVFSEHPLNPPITFSRHNKKLSLVVPHVNSENKEKIHAVVTKKKM